MKNSTRVKMSARAKISPRAIVSQCNFVFVHFSSLVQFLHLTTLKVLVQVD